MLCGVVVCRGGGGCERGRNGATGEWDTEGRSVVESFSRQVTRQELFLFRRQRSPAPCALGTQAVGNENSLDFFSFISSYLMAKLAKNKHRCRKTNSKERKQKTSTTKTRHFPDHPPANSYPSRKTKTNQNRQAKRRTKKTET